MCGTVPTHCRYVLALDVARPGYLVKPRSARRAVDEFYCSLSSGKQEENRVTYWLLQRNQCRSSMPLSTRQGEGPTWKGNDSALQLQIVLNSSEPRVGGRYQHGGASHPPKIEARGAHRQQSKPGLEAMIAPDLDGRVRSVPASGRNPGRRRHLARMFDRGPCRLIRPADWSGSIGSFWHSRYGIITVEAEPQTGSVHAPAV